MILDSAKSHSNNKSSFELCCCLLWGELSWTLLLWTLLWKWCGIRRSFLIRKCGYSAFIFGNMKFQNLKSLLPENDENWFLKIDHNIKIVLNLSVLFILAIITLCCLRTNRLILLYFVSWNRKIFCILYNAAFVLILNVYTTRFPILFVCIFSQCYFVK